MGQKLAAYDATAGGKIVGFYDDVDSPAPDGVTTIEISEDQWQICLTQQNQWIVQSGALEEILPSDAELLTQARSLQLNLLNASCRSTIAAGYNSSALGSPHSYPSLMSDQQNLVDAMCESLVPNLPNSWSVVIWCADAMGNWSLTPHTAAQTQHVHSDWMAFRVAAQQKLGTLTAQINAATQVDAVNAINWS